MGDYHSTLCVRKGNIEVGKFCAFQNKSCAKGHHWEIHKGRLQPVHSYQLRKVVVKVCPVRQCSHDECQAEVQKMDFAEEVLKNSSDLKVFKLCRTYKAEVDDACKVFNVFPSGRHKAVIEEGTPVLIQDRVDGPIQTFFDFDEEPDVSSTIWSCFLDLALASYRQSGGTRVIAGMKGLVLRNPKDSGQRGQGPKRYMLTSLVVHSVEQEFGSKDKGAEGLRAFLRTLESAGITLPPETCGRRRAPSAPPLEDADDVFTYAYVVPDSEPPHWNDVPDDVLTYKGDVSGSPPRTPPQKLFSDQIIPPFGNIYNHHGGLVRAKTSSTPPCDGLHSLESQFGFPPTYESVVLELGQGQTDLPSRPPPPPYTEKCNDSVFLLGLASRAFVSDVFNGNHASSPFLQRSCGRDRISRPAYE